MKPLFLGALTAALLLAAPAALVNARAAGRNPFKKVSKLQAADHAVAGRVEKIDSKSKTMLIKAADGTEQKVKYTEKTTVNGLEDAATATDHVAHEGDQVVVRYVGEGAHKTATEVEHVGEEPLQRIDGTVEKVDQTTHTVVVKAADGTEQTYHMADHALVDTGKNVKYGTENALKEGDHVVVNFTQEAGDKVAHLFSHFGH
jgi:hypothetical protein